MGKKSKKIPAAEDVVKKFEDDFDSNAIQIYAVKDVPDMIIGQNLIHPSVLEKSTSVFVAGSGCPVMGRDYLCIGALRIDEENGCMVTDIDPIMMVYDTNCNYVEPSGVVTFHGSFEGRTEVEYSSLNISVKHLRSKIKTEKIPFEKAPKRIQEAMHFMAKEYREKMDNDSDDNSGRCG